MSHLVQEILGHEDGQDGIHAVVRKAFGRFVADDEGNAWWHRGDVGRRGCVFVVGHNGALIKDVASLGKIRPALARTKVSQTPFRWPSTKLFPDRPVPFGPLAFHRGDVFRRNKWPSRQWR